MWVVTGWVPNGLTIICLIYDGVCTCIVNLALFKTACDKLISNYPIKLWV